MVTETRADLDQHIEWANRKEEVFQQRFEQTQKQIYEQGLQGARRTEQIEALGERMDEAVTILRETNSAVNTLRGVVSAAYRAGKAALGDSQP